MSIVYFAALTSFALCYVVLPSVINFALQKKLYTHSGARSSHSQPTPALGGIGIFGGLFMATLFWTPFSTFSGIQYVLLAIMVIFLTGLKDDLTPLSAQKKLVAQLMTAILIVYFADIRLESLHGMFSWEGDMPYWLSVLLSVFTVLVVTNAFNLIDGINGLAASLAIIAASCMGIWFALVGEIAQAVLAFSCAGALIAFLRFNLIPPARVFMGDTGSLVLGTVISVLSLEFIEINGALYETHPLHFEATAVVTMTIIAVPLFDTLRVFITRIVRGRSPFQPDRRHIHHLLIDSGCTHLKATSILVGFQLGLIATVYLLHARVEQHFLLLLLLSIVLTGTYILYRAAKRKKAEIKRQQEEEVRVLPDAGQLMEKEVRQIN
ncbi:MAG: MraY family glycosyltransferase [Bacteroidota bacterium]